MALSSKATTISLCVGALAGAVGWAGVSFSERQPEQPKAPESADHGLSHDDALSVDEAKAITAHSEESERRNAERPEPTEAFDQATRTPSYSIPLSESEVEQREAANRSETRVPLADDSQVDIETDRFHYEPGQSIEVRVERTPGGVGSNAVVSIGEHEASLTRSGDSASGSIETPGEPGEQQVNVDFTVAGEDLSLGTTVAINRDIGEIHGVGRASIDADELQIPVDVGVVESGYYRVEGYAQVSGYDWVRVEREDELGSGDSTVDLALHGSALTPQQDDDSPSADELTLRSLTLTQLPASPGDRTWSNDDSESERHTDAPTGLDRIEGADYTPPAGKAQLQKKRREFLSRIGE